MQSFNKRKYVHDVVGGLYKDDIKGISLDSLVNEVLNNSWFVFETAKTDDELLNGITALVNASISHFEYKSKGDNQKMSNNSDSLYHVVDPKTLSFDVSGDNESYKKMLIKLYELDKSKQNKNYAYIFFERYIQKLPSEVICNLNKIDSNELNSRLLDIIKFINKES